MAHEINRKQLNYMQAYIKYYDDGSEILQSYNTDVVKKTPDGKYIRLWSSWSPSTMKQVRAYCGKYFRALPFADGTYEDLIVRRGYEFRHSYTPKVKSVMSADVKDRVANFWRNLKNKNYEWLVKFDYNSTLNKFLKAQCKSKKRQILIDALYSCATHKPTRNAIGILCKLYNFNIQEVWRNSLKKDWGELENKAKEN